MTTSDALYSESKRHCKSRIPTAKPAAKAAPRAVVSADCGKGKIVMAEREDKIRQVQDMYGCASESGQAMDLTSNELQSIAHMVLHYAMLCCTAVLCCAMQF